MQQHVYVRTKEVEPDL